MNKRPKATITHRVLWWLYQPYKFLIYIPLLGIATGFWGALAVVLSFILGERIASYCGVIWARILAWGAPMLLTVEGREHIDPAQSYVIVVNHQSHFDILALYGWLGIDFKWVMKQELRKVPALGIACEKVGHVFIDRSDTKTALASINAARKKITGGTSVLFFPEGSRSIHGDLHPFKKGAFKMALDLGIPLLPITLNNTCHILPTNTMNLFPGSARMIIHPPIEIGSYADENIAELMERTRGVIASRLEVSTHDLPN